MNRITGRYETYYYSCRDGFYVQIELDKEDDQGKIYNCCLWHKDYGTKTFMCGIPRFQKGKDTPYQRSEIEEIIEASLDDDIDSYIEEVFD